MKRETGFTQRQKAYQVIKQEQKDLAKKIVELKLQRKEDNRKGKSTWKINSDIRNTVYEYRHKHIARCLLRGREYSQIECPAKGNEPDWNAIETYKKEYLDMIEQPELSVEAA